MCPVYRGFTVCNRYTALHLAALSGKEKVIVHLLDLGADVHARDHGGKKPKDMVRNTVSDKVQMLLGRTFVIDSSTVIQSGVSARGGRRLVKVQHFWFDCYK